MLIKSGCDSKAAKYIVECTGGHIDDSFLSVLVALVVFYISHDYLSFSILLSGAASGAAASSDEDYREVDQDEIDVVQLPSDDAGCI